MLSFDHKTYVNLMRESSELAKKYKIDCGLLEKAPEVTEEKVEAPVETPVEAKEETTDVVEESKEISRDELKAKLKEAEIKFFNWAKTEKLVELCIENNLL